MNKTRHKIMSVRVTHEEFHELEVIADARKYCYQRRGNVSHFVRLLLVDAIAKFKAECAQTESIKKSKRTSASFQDRL